MVPNEKKRALSPLQIEDKKKGTKKENIRWYFYFFLRLYKSIY